MSGSEQNSPPNESAQKGAEKADATEAAISTGERSVETTDDSQDEQQGSPTRETSEGSSSSDDISLNYEFVADDNVDDAGPSASEPPPHASPWEEYFYLEDVPVCDASGVVVVEEIDADVAEVEAVNAIMRVPTPMEGPDAVPIPPLEAPAMIMPEAEEVVVPAQPIGETIAIWIGLFVVFAFSFMFMRAHRRGYFQYFRDAMQDPDRDEL